MVTVPVGRMPPVPVTVTVNFSFPSPPKLTEEGAADNVVLLEPRPTVRVKVQVPESLSVSASVPDATQLPFGRVPVVLMAPDDETSSPQGLEEVTKLTALFWSLVSSWLVKADDAALVVVPLLGAFWVMETGVTVRVKRQVPESPKVSESEPETVHVPAGRVPPVLTAPEDDTATPQALEVVT
jgi:hypothetical protein